MSGNGALLSLDVTVDYPGRPCVLRDVSLELRPGEILGLVGRSGSGKSTLVLAILRLLHLKGGAARGAIWFQGRNLLAARESEMRGIRGRDIGLVLQSPLSSLNPALRLGTQLKEAWRAHNRGGGPGWRGRISELMRSVSLPADPAFLRSYPRELSMGMAQRALIAMGIMHGPSLLLADEPTSALDAITQAEILRLFGQLNREMGMAILLISHDLLSAASLCHRVAILHEGRIAECGDTDRIFSRPEHPYTRKLLDAIPRPHAVTAS